MKKEPPLIESLQKASMDKGRSRFFLVFLLLSFFLWFIAKFSKTYTEVIAFELSFDNTPVGLVPQLVQPLEVETTLTATGFQFLYYRFFDKQLSIDLAEARFEENKATVQLAAQFQALQEQLLGDTQIINYFPTEIEFDFQRQLTKKVPVVAPALELALGYTAINVEFQPDSVEVLGPESELTKLKFIQPIYSNNSKIQQSFTSKANLPKLGNTLKLNINSVEMKVSVDRFSEEEFNLPIVLKNAPLNEVLKFFPSKVKLTFSAPLQELKNITPEDFIIGIAYDRLNPNENRATIEVFQVPEKVQNMRWEPKTVEYLIRQ
ncbi:MAG: CdaR family protein [Flavobacteriaceae bacterium]